MKEEKTFRQGSWTVNCRLTTENVCFFSPEGRSSEIAKYAAAVRTVCEKIARVQSTMYRPEVSRSAQTKKSTQLRVHTHAYLAIKASISARNAAISPRKSASARSWFLHSASLKSLCLKTKPRMTKPRMTELWKSASLTAALPGTWRNRLSAGIKSALSCRSASPFWQRQGIPATWDSLKPSSSHAVHHCYVHKKNLSVV